MNGRGERPATNEAPCRCEIARRDRLIAVSGQADLDSFGQVPHPADARAQVVAVAGRIREWLERVGADLSDLAKLVVFHIPEPECGERKMRERLRAVAPVPRAAVEERLKAPALSVGSEELTGYMDDLHNTFKTLFGN